ncbi:Receptor-like protein kinase FERONIA [Vitis vinifera]|uniref:Receptor-like protein kinase FERONIA n=1 Tax=Vitis vinifera TaxID=29760 RepID=A0A438DPU1_VITVI|nr:Receptor-like protein kinase FERONIA [Vitis vinifera]
MPLSIPPPQLRLTMAVATIPKQGSSYTNVAQGSFRDRFYKTNKVLLTWKQWLKIGIGAARGLKHLHQGSECEIIHQDIKTTDISLDEKRVAKFADFGVVLFEVLCAGLAVEGSLMKERSLRGTETKVMQCYAEGRWKGFRD